MTTMADSTQPSTSTTSAGGFTVRAARPADLAEACALIRRVLENDLHVAYNPYYHFDIDYAQAVYLDDPRHNLFVAVDDATDEILGTTGLRNHGPQSPPHPQWLAEKYTNAQTVQLFRVYIKSEQRRRGAARQLVEAARRWAKEQGYTAIYLHTDPNGPGALPFWLAMPTTQLYDSRDHPETATNAVHFELALPE